MTTIYQQDETGSIEFKSERKAWGVDIPAYVYDLWMPLIGSDCLGVLGVYYRLEREGNVHGMSLKRLAKMCRIGKDKLHTINETLKECGFIRIEKPTGWQRLAHYTTKIITMDPPQSVSAEIIEQFRPKPRPGYEDTWEYEPLTQWLVEQIVPKADSGLPGDPDGDAGEPEQVDDKDLNRDAKIDPSLLVPPVIGPSLKDSDAKSASGLPVKKGVDWSALHRESSEEGKERKPKSPTTDLERFLLELLIKKGSATTGIADGYHRKLNTPISIDRQGVSLTMPSPEDQWNDPDMHEDFKAFVILVVDQIASRNKKSDKPKPPSWDHVVNGIRDYNRLEALRARQVEARRRGEGEVFDPSKAIEI